MRIPLSLISKAVIVFCLVAFATAGAFAGPIRYIFSASASGDLATPAGDDFVFNSQPLVVTIFGDTNNVTTTDFGLPDIFPTPIPYITTGLTGQLTVSGFGTDPATGATAFIGTAMFPTADPLYVFYDNVNDPLSGLFETVGFGTLGIGDLIDLFGTGLGTGYHLRSAVGPVFAADAFAAQFGGIVFDRGTLTLDEFDITNASFQSTVPEPATICLLGSGLVGIVLLGRRRRQVR